MTKPENSLTSRPASKTRLATAVSAALLASLTAETARAQQLEEVIVTATKRAESVLDVSVSMTAMSGTETRLLNLNDIKDLIQFTPGITGNSKDSFLDTISVRGIRTNLFGNGAEPSIGFFMNGTYQGRTGSAVSGLFDVERTEVLRGPQGFLFARGAVTGAINVITEKATTDDLNGFAEIDVGERGVFVFEGGVNVPITDNFAMRIAGLHTEEDGYVENLFGGDDLIEHDNDSLRVSFNYTTEKFNGDLILQYDDRDQSGSVYRVTGEGPNFSSGPGLFLNGGEPWNVGDSRNVNVNDEVGSRDETEVSAFTLLMDYDLGFAMLSSLTHYKDHDYEYGEDFDGLPITLFEYEQFQSGDYFETELRLTSQTDGPLDWYAGISYYEEDIETTFGNIQSEDVYCDLYLNYYLYAGQAYRGCQAYYNYAGYDFTPSTNGLINDYNETKGKYDGYSAYVEVGYAFSEQFDIAAGVRYQEDNRDYSNERLADLGGSQFSGGVQGQPATPDGVLSASDSWSDTTFRLVANWRPNDDTLLFASVATGYKPGGFDTYGFQNIATGETSEGEALRGVDEPASFDEETVTSYEVGYKAALADNRVQVALTGFLYEYEDLQSFFTQPNPVGAGFQTVAGNVGTLDGWGAELEVSAALTDNINLRVGASWLDSEANDVQAFCGEAENLGGTLDDCEGEKLPLAPEYTAFAVLNAVFPMGNGELFGNIAWSWEDDMRGDWIPPSLAEQTINTIDQTDIILGYQTQSWFVSGYVENVFDNTWDDGTFGEGFDGTAYPQYVFGPARPRTAGVRLGYYF
ncbi:MAG: TonB-dependent receptor [Halieaceae bacterium]|nr:TonB-dependent receptor [Halieaceae bacterium]